LKSSPSVHLGRVFALLMGVLLLSGLFLCAATAQTRGRYRTSAPPAPRRRPDKPLSSYNISDLPLQRITPEQFTEWQQASARAMVTGAAAPAPPATNTQFQDLTTNPRPPLVGPSTLSRDIQPNWAPDQNSVYFASNNVDPVANFGATAPTPNDRYHIYQMDASGNTVVQITGSTG
jgi:hypothetical protein